MPGSSIGKWRRTYAEEEKSRNGEVSLNACTLAASAASATSERRIVADVGWTAVQ